MLPPAAKVFQPDFVMISAGFDGHRDDSLAAMQLTEQGYARLTRITMDIAREHCEGRLISMLEGGYDLAAFSASVVAHLDTLCGRC
jgi:acetoin utilization deacetylase AcuC-like enzyme